MGRRVRFFARGCLRRNPDHSSLLNVTLTVLRLSHRDWCLLLPCQLNLLLAPELPQDYTKAKLGKEVTHLTENPRLNRTLLSVGHSIPSMACRILSVSFQLRLVIEVKDIVDGDANHEENQRATVNG